jgi:hypothetical protein
MGRRSRQRYLRYFTSEEMCKNYNRIYQMLLGDQKA